MISHNFPSGRIVGVEWLGSRCVDSQCAANVGAFDGDKNSWQYRESWDAGLEICSIGFVSGDAVDPAGDSIALFGSCEAFTSSNGIRFLGRHIKRVSCCGVR